MKGVVFTIFQEMVEDKFGFEVVDQIIENSKLPSGGAYTSVGTYDHGELVSMVVQLSETTKIPVPDLIKVFGEHLFGEFVKGYPAFFENATSAFEFLKNVHGYIHVEVRKLYPDAELPSIDHEVLDSGAFALTYTSTRPFADLAEGLIRSCLTHFGEECDIQREDLTDDGTSARFLLSPVAATHT